MRRQESQPEACLVCGDDVDLGDADIFWLSNTVVACGICSAKHGGVFDPESERWKIPPQFSALKSRMPEED